MHKLLSRQLAKSQRASSEIDLRALLQLVSDAYEQADSDRRRTDRSISLMIKELEQLNRRLDQLVQERTSALGEREAELRAQNLRFDAALQNMAHGLCMFDKDERLIVCNERYLEMYGHTRERIKPGTTLREILQTRVVGMSSEDAEAYIEQRLQPVHRREPSYSENKLRDGRFIAVNYQPMADGGWVAIHQDITERKRTESQLAFLARHDSLTGIANRSVLIESMKRALAQARTDGARFAILLLDLDLFKNVNDSLGHPIGDRLLKEVAGRLSATLAASDTVARLGGDEFAIVCRTEGDPRDAAAREAGKLLAAVQAPSILTTID